MQINHANPTIMANYSVSSFMSFLKANHDFSKGKGPEIRDWNNGGHSIFCVAIDGTQTRIDSPIDPSKLSVAFTAASLSKADVIVVSGTNKNGEPCNTVIDRVDFAPDTVTTAADWGI